MGFEEVAAEEAGVLVGLEVAHADDDRLRRERGSDRRDALRDALDEVVPRRRVGGGSPRDLCLERLWECVEFGEGARVDADSLVDDELEPRQPDAVVRQLGEGECLVGHADVEHEIDRDLRHPVERRLLDGVVEDAPVDEPIVAFRAGDRHTGAIRQHLCAGAGSHDGGDAQLSRHDGGMAGSAAAVGHDRGRLPHDRLPVGVRAVGDQHIARLEEVHQREIVHHANGPGADLLADRPTRREHIAARSQHESAQHALVASGDDGLGAGLHDVERPVDPVARPFDVHRMPVVGLDREGAPRELLDVVIRDAEPRTIVGVDIVQHGAVTDPRACRVSERDRLRPQLTPEDRRSPRRSAGLYT